MFLARLLVSLPRWCFPVLVFKQVTSWKLLNLSPFNPLAVNCPACQYHKAAYMEIQIR